MSEKESRELPLYHRGLIMGLLLGIIGNLFVSYLIKILDFLGVRSWGWIMATVVSFAGILILVWLMNGEIKKLSGKKEGVEP